MLRAFGLGLLAQSSLLAAGLLACVVTVPRRILGIVAGFGAGAMIAAISFDLIDEASELSFPRFGVTMLVGAGTFLLADRTVERRYGNQGTGAALGVVVGAVIDGIPESTILGVQLATGITVSTSFLVAVLVSNPPEALAPSAELSAAGWSVRRIARLWLSIVLVCAIAAAVGYYAADVSSLFTGEALAAFAAGGLLATVSDSLIPFAYEHGGELAGLGTVVGFIVALVLS